MVFFFLESSIYMFVLSSRTFCFFYAYTHRLAYYLNIFVRSSSICANRKNNFETYFSWLFRLLLNVIHTTLDIFRRKINLKKSLGANNNLRKQQQNNKQNDSK